ncbi:hypothetical protein, partial [Bradyrhizobium sp.]|uniref:hypothetical protein n=1 Tax=Bradyrhizobium sp. TaxID=376 RepID=UPI003C78E3F3
LLKPMQTIPILEQVFHWSTSHVSGVPLTKFLAYILLIINGLVLLATFHYGSSKDEDVPAGKLAAAVAKSGIY